jgi:uncharacterized protein YjbI with pentapeptide repeats
VELCRYGINNDITYVDEDSGLRVTYRCVREPTANSDFCIFHEYDDGKRNNQQINEAFLALLEEFNHTDTKLVVIGFKLEKLELPKKVNARLLMEHAILSEINFDGIEFNKDIVFSYSKLSNVSFVNTKFEKKVYFIYCTFLNKVSFRTASFYDEANFNLANFEYEADFQSSFFGDKPIKVSTCLSERIKEEKNSLTYFNGTNFLGGVRFDGCHFGRQTFFDDATFKVYAWFGLARFHKAVVFTGAHFHCDASFDLVEFSDIASFVRTNFREGSVDNRLSLHAVKFNGEADFKRCNFGRVVFNERIHEDRITRELNQTIFRQKADFSGSIFDNKVTIFNTSFEQDVLYTKCFFSDSINLNFVSFKIALFDSCDFDGEIEMSVISLPSDNTSIRADFSHSSFRKRVRINGTISNPINLSSVSFKGVDLSNFEFNNVVWIETQGVDFLRRGIIIDEILLDKNKNFEDVIKIYNQLRKNYESKLLFSEASHFFVGEMESRRKWLKSRSKRGRDGIATFYHNSYRILAWYGESVSLPLLIWAPLTIIAFTILRSLACQQCSDLQILFGNPECISPESSNWMKLGIDSMAAFFPVPFSKSHFDTIEHIVGLPILGAAFIALKRRFERVR